MHRRVGTPGKKWCKCYAHGDRNWFSRTYPWVHVLFKVRSVPAKYEFAKQQHGDSARRPKLSLIVRGWQFPDTKGRPRVSWLWILKRVDSWCLLRASCAVGRLALETNYNSFGHACLRALLAQSFPIFRASLNHTHMFTTSTLKQYECVCAGGGVSLRTPHWLLTEHTYETYMTRKTSQPTRAKRQATYSWQGARRRRHLHQGARDLRVSVSLEVDRDPYSSPRFRMSCFL